MPEIRTAADALYAASRTYTAYTPEPIEADGQVIGWTFAASVRGTTEFGWVLTDGTVSPSTEDYRTSAAEYALMVDGEEYW